MARAIAATAAALAALTVLVLTGVLTELDNWAIDHVMPGLDPYSDVGVVTLNGLWRPFAFDAVWWAKLLGAYLYPASFLISGLIAIAVCIGLYRRGRQIAAVVWLGAWVAANAVELTMKLALARPDVHWSNGARPIHVGTFDHSFPSGHTTRSVVVAGLVAYAVPRVAPLVAGWAALVPVALVAGGDHTISDVGGGLLLGLLGVLAAHAMMRAWTRWPPSSSGSSVESSGTPRPSSPTSRAARSGSPTRS